MPQLVLLVLTQTLQTIHVQPARLHAATVLPFSIAPTAQMAIF